MHPARVMPLAALALWLTLTTGLTAVDFSGKQVAVPEAWKGPPAVAADGYGYYLAVVTTPPTWRERDWTFVVEAVDDVREFFVDGKRIGGLGEMPPNFRSGLGETARLAVPAAQRGPGDTHVIAVRVYYRDGRTGFNVAAPALMSGEESIRLAGNWLFQAGDHAAWPRLTAAELKVAAISKVEPTADVERSFKNLADDDVPLSPQESLQRLTTPADLQLQLVLADPDIAQPLSMKWDARGRLWVVEYRQYPNPAGLMPLSRDKFLRTVYDKVPPAPPNHFRGADRISIHSDADGDGAYESHKTFVEGLSLVSSVAFDAQGVWVLNPPYLLFYPDANGDDVPDGDPEVHLEGFGIEDAHSVASNLRWGPDGWLYGAQGSTVSGNVRRPGEKEVVHSQGQLIWRYHPRQRRYEVFAEGGGNTFGVEIDSAGRIFSGHNGGNTRGFHYVQGGYSQKGFGKHGALSNPYTFGYFEAMKHPDAPRFTHCFVINDDAALGEKYRGGMFAVAPLQGQVTLSRVQSDGSTFKTIDDGLAVTSRDGWFRPVDIQQGPDGALYIADFYEQRIDHASHYQGRIHAESGRIYRLTAKDAKPTRAVDLTALSGEQLLARLPQANRWERQTIQQLLPEHELSLTSLEAAWRSAKGSEALGLFWALHRRGAVNESLMLAALQHEEPQVRRWAVQLACNDGKVSQPLATGLAELAYREPHVEVRSQLASSARRLPVTPSLAILKHLLRRSEDRSDPHIPLLLWWGLEVHCEKHRDAVIALLAEPTFWNEPLVCDVVLERLMKRFAQAGSRNDLATCAKLLALAPSPEMAKRLMAGLETALEGRSLAAAPPELSEAFAKYGGGSLLLRLRRGDSGAVDEALQMIADEQGDAARRSAVIAALPVRGNAPVTAKLLQLARKSRNDEVRGAAISALGASDAAHIGAELLALHESVTDDLRLVIQNVVVGRAAWATQLIAHVEAKQIAAERVSPVLIRKLRLLPDERLQRRITALWGEGTVADPAALSAQLAQYETALAAATGNPYAGHKLFTAQCGKCHVLFGEGGKIGPDLTVYKRDDLRGMLTNILQPSLEIREGYETYMVQTDDGRLLSGFIADQDAGVVVLRGIDGKNVVVPRGTIEDMRAAPISLMPEGLLQGLSPEQVRDLFAYLRATQPLPQ
jgi:putative heme-binding domain-containing protein